MKQGLLDFLQSMSNAAAETVSGPIDLISMGLRGAGIPVPQDAMGSSEWMKRRGLVREVRQSPASLAGETVGLLAPATMVAAPAKVAGGLLQMADNAMTPAIMNRQRGVVKIPGYGIEHRPMTVEGGAARLHDLTPSFGNDIYSSNALQYFGSGDPRERKVLQLLRGVKGNPDAMVNIYRGVPDDVTSINPGDWVTLLPEYAQDYGKVISMKVPARTITSWPDSLAEFGFYPD